MFRRLASEMVFLESAALLSKKKGYDKNDFLVQARKAVPAADVFRIEVIDSLH